MSVCQGLLLLQALISAQEVHAGIGALETAITIELAPVRDPYFLLVSAKRAFGLDSDAILRLDGRDLMLLSRCDLAPDEFLAHVAIEDPGSRHVLEIAPKAAGLRLDPVRKLPAAVYEVTFQEEASKAFLPGILHIISTDGRDPPILVPGPGEPFLRSALLIPDGRRRILLPAGAPATLAGTVGGLRSPIRIKVDPTPKGRSGLKLMFHKSLVPEGARLLEAPLREGLDREAGKRLDLALGIAGFPEDLVPLAAETAQEIPEAFILRLLDDKAVPPLLSDRTVADGLPASLRPLRTVRLENGAHLHTNGPILSVAPLVRYRSEGRVRSEVEIRLPPDVTEGQLRLISGEATQFAVTVRNGDRVPLELALPERTRRVLAFLGKPFTGESVAQTKPMAFRVLVLP